MGSAAVTVTQAMTDVDQTLRCGCRSHSPAVVKESCDCGSPDTGAKLCRHACNRSSCTQECLLHSLPCNECSGCDNVWKEMAMGDKTAARVAKADDPNKARKPHESHRTHEGMRQTEHGHHTSAVTEEEKRFRRAEMMKEYTASFRQRDRDALVGKEVVVMFEGHGGCPGLVESHDSGNKFYVKWDFEDTVDKYTTTLPRAESTNRPTFSTLVGAGRTKLCDW